MNHALLIIKNAKQSEKRYRKTANGRAKDIGKKRKKEKKTGRGDSERFV